MIIQFEVSVFTAEILANVQLGCEETRRQAGKEPEVTHPGLNMSSVTCYATLVAALIWSLGFNS